MHTTEQQPGDRSSPEADAEVRAGQIRLLYQNAPGIYFATLGAAIIAGALLWRALPRTHVAAWLTLGVFVTAARFCLLDCYRRRAPSDADLARWGRYFTAASAAGAVLWASAAFVLFVPGDAYYDAFVVILIAGMMAGASFSFSVYPPTFHVFVLPVTAALLARLLSLADMETDYGLTMLALAGLVCLFVPLVYFFARRTERNLTSLIESQWRNRQLSETLASKLAELESSHRSLEEENRARMHSENVLRRNEEQLRLFELAIATTPSGVAFTDPGQRDNPVVYVNPAFSRITGYSADEALGRSLRFLAAGDEQSEGIARLRSALREEKPRSLVLRSRRKDGAPFWSDMRITPLRDETGRVLRFVIVQDDVTARVDMEAVLRKTRDELQAVLDNAPELIYTKDLDGRLLMVNRQWQNVFNLAAEEVVGKRVSDIFPAAYAEAMRASDLKVVESGKPLQIEQPVPVRKGPTSHLTTKFPLRDGSGRIYGVCGISTDITERKREQVLQGIQHHVSRVIAESSAVQDALARVLHIVCESTPWDWGAVYLVDRESGGLQAVETWGDARIEGSEFARLAISAAEQGPGAAFIARARLAHEPVWISDLQRTSDARMAQAAVSVGLNSGVAMPIFVDSGVVGMLTLYACDKRDPERAFLRMARSVGQQLGQFARRRDAEEQTRRAEERLELALEGSELALWDWNIPTGEIYLSPRWAEMLQRPVAATHTTLDELTQLVHPDDRASIREAILSAFKAQSTLYAVLHRVRTMSGAWIWIQSTGKVVERDAQGRALRMAGTNADVTARLASEDALNRTREELQAILDNSPAMICAKDMHGNVMVTNRPALRDVTYETSSHPAARGLHPHDREVIDSKRPLQTEELVFEEDRPHTYLCARFPLRQPKGALYGVCTIATDITDRKRMEAALGESEDRFRQFAESVNVGFWILDWESGALAYGNPALRRILGIAGAEPARFGDRKLELVHEADRDTVRGSYGRWTGSGVPERLDIDYRITRPDGEVRWLHDHAVMLQDDKGRVYRILGITEDVTERKAGEEELLQTRTFLESIIEHLPLTIFVKNADDLRYVRLNRAGEALLGVSRDAIVGKRDSEFFSSELAELYLRNDRDVLAARTAIDILEQPVETRDGGRRYVQAKKMPIYDGAGKALYILGIAEDVTDRKLASEAINDMNAALAKKAADLATSNEELEAFAYSVSHDLRAPLRHVNGFINLLRDHVGDRLDATGQRYLAKIQTASGRMSALIDELLALSRTSRIEMRYTRVSLERLIKEILQELRGQATERKIECVVGELPSVQGDRILLRQAFVNLLDNAFKYTAGKPEARIEVACEDRDGDEVTISVRDNGVGFDMKYAHKLFGVFQRLHRQEEFPGTGIGLAHVRRIVERHGGRVWAQGVKGEGALFFVALPKGEEK